MSKKSKLGLLISVGAIAVLMLLGFVQKDSYSTEETVDSLWDKYSVQSTQFDADKGDTNNILDISVYDKSDINKVESYLENNLSDEDLEYYKLNVYEWSSDVGEFKDNAQENLDSDDLNPDN